MRALAMPKKGQKTSRTCRGCGRMLRLELFEKKPTISGYGMRCKPCALESRKRQQRTFREWEKHARKAAAELVRARALKPDEEDEIVVSKPRTGRYSEQNRLCLGPCRKMFLSSSCGHRICERCEDLENREER